MRRLSADRIASGRERLTFGSIAPGGSEWRP